MSLFRREDSEHAAFDIANKLEETSSVQMQSVIKVTLIDVPVMYDPHSKSNIADFVQTVVELHGKFM